MESGIDGAARALARARRGRIAGALLAQAIVLAALLFVFLRGWDRDFTVPIGFSRDSLSAALQSKSTIDNGWWWFNPRVGAPFGLDALQYPAAPNVDQAIVWIVSRVVRDPIGAINAAWLLMVVLSGLSATWCITRLGASMTSALVAGTLFALCPYALARNVSHVWLVIYLTPFAGTAAVLLASGRASRWYGGPAFVVPFIGCALLAFDYVYYAFFACVLVLTGALIGSLQHRARRALGAGVLCLAILGVGTALNLAPSFHSWAVRGVPLAVPDKTPAEAEVYGLKIRHLLSPIRSHTFPPFRAWLARERAAAFPLENENANTRLGVVASAGFLALVALLFVPRIGRDRPHGDTLEAASRLTLAAVLLATVGGFGSLFNLLVSPDIRAYNRIVPFIAFFALTAVALVIDGWCRSTRARVTAAAAIGIVGLVDQRAGAVLLNAVHKDVAVEYANVRQFVATLETQLPAGAMVFQLPVRQYPDPDTPARMLPYDHIKMYLTSRTLRWSYPALSNQQERWQQAAAALPIDRLLPELASQGFAAVLVDRYGYMDNGAAVLSDLARQPSAPILDDTPRYVVVDLRRMRGPAPEDSVLAHAAGTTPATAGLPVCQTTTPPLDHVDRVGAVAPSAQANGPWHVGRGTFQIEGWALDAVSRSTAIGVDVVVDGATFQTIYGFGRQDVSGHFAQPAYEWSGFLAAIPAGRLGRGTHALSLRIAAADARCAYDTPAQSLVVE